MLWIITAGISFYTFREQLLAAFNERLRAGAEIVAQKTSVQPKIVPLPHGEESFSIIYSINNTDDTLYSSASLKDFTATGDSLFRINDTRGIAYAVANENGGILKVNYFLPSADTDKRIINFLLLLFAILAAGLLIAAFIANIIARKILRPVMEVIRTANETNLHEGKINYISSEDPDEEPAELVASFNRMIERISEQSLRQTAFFASASHELRTPLSVMQTRLQVLMQEKYENDEKNSFYSDQLREVKKLSKMVNDFLLLSGIQQGSIKPLEEEINLTEIISELTANHHIAAAEKCLHFQISFHPPEADYIIHSDKEKLLIILNNLAENAVKYAEENSMITVGCFNEQEKIRITISNIIREDIDPDPLMISQGFYHAKPLHGEGFGLGLWIADTLAGFLNVSLNLKIPDSRFEAEVIFLGKSRIS